MSNRTLSGEPVMRNERTIEIPGCRRAAEREGVTLAASALALGCSRSVIVSDLSPTGARFDGHDLPGTGEEVLMVAGAHEAFAKVVWRTDKKCGVHFDDTLADEELVRIKKDAAWASVACFYN
jgi:hypothetical protein